MEAIDVAIVGLDRYADLLIELLDGSERFNLAAVCDPRSEMLRKCEQGGVTWQLFDDPREMIMRAKVQVLIVWHGWGVAETYQEAAADKGTWLVQRITGNSSLGSSGKMLRKADKAGIGIFVWSPWMFVPSFESATEWLEDQQIRAVLARFVASDKNIDWPSLDHPLPALTYPSLFMIQRWLGLPESVFCRELIRSGQESETPIQYHSSVNLIYRHSLASVSASLNSGPDRHQVFIHGSEGTVEVGTDRARWYNTKGRLITSGERYSAERARRIGYERNLAAIWQAYQEQQRSTPFELKRHIGVMGMVEAAALSARTGHPEQLAKIPELSDIIAIG